MRGENPDFLENLDEGQYKTILTGSGKFFADQFVHVHGEHCYIVGPTGSGKTNKGYGIVNWLMHTETIIWISSGKDNEILPLLFLGKPVRIITPKYHDVQITKGKELLPSERGHIFTYVKTDRDTKEETILHTEIPIHPEIIRVSNPEYAWLSIRKGHINIFEFRNAFWEKDKLLEWMIELFTVLATWTRLGRMPHINPAAIFIDESRWVVAGSRISNEGMRTKASEIITENAMEIRSYGFRLVIFAQDFTDVPPAMRDNMPCFILCSGAEIETNRKLRYHCNPNVQGWKRTIQYKRNEAKFVDRFGNASPNDRPVPWPLFPKKEEDRELCRRMKVKDVGFHDRPPEETELEEECFPELGRFSASAIPPEKQEVPEFSRFGAGMIDNE